MEMLGFTVWVAAKIVAHPCASTIYIWHCEQLLTCLETIPGEVNSAGKYSRKFDFYYFIVN